MEIKKDAYCEMLSHNLYKDYPANISHWSLDARPICIEEDVFRPLANAYAGKYVEVNSSQPSPHAGVDLEGVSYDNCLFWMPYPYGAVYILLFVRLPELTNTNIVQLLGKFDVLYGCTNQETDDWALEYQILTRMLVHNKCLLVDPLNLNIREVFQELTECLSERDLEIFTQAMKIAPNAIRKAIDEHDCMIRENTGKETLCQNDAGKM